MSPESWATLEEPGHGLPPSLLLTTSLILYILLSRQTRESGVLLEENGAFRDLGTQVFAVPEASGSCVPQSSWEEAHLNCGHSPWL